MKIRFFIASAAVCAVIGFGFSFDFQTANGADRSANFGARCAVSSFQAAFDQSKAVFVGEVVGEEKTGDVRTFDFEVERYWKGSSAKRIKIHVYETARFQAWFKEGGRYLIYAPADENGRLRVSRCSRSRDAESAEEDLQKLGQGKIPR